MSHWQWTQLGVQAALVGDSVILSAEHASALRASSKESTVKHGFTRSTALTKNCVADGAFATPLQETAYVKLVTRESVANGSRGAPMIAVGTEFVKETQGMSHATVEWRGQETIAHDLGAPRTQRASSVPSAASVRKRMGLMDAYVPREPEVDRVTLLFLRSHLAQLHPYL